MIVKRADFVLSMREYGEYPRQGLPEIAFAGRSNVGKSSMINCLTGRPGLARTSRTPGRTRLINIFCLNEAICLVDLPGYGYAKVSREERDSWGDMMERYFSRTETLRQVFHLVDIRHEPSREDCQMNEYLRANGIPFTAVATKADKISRGARLRYIAPICRALSVQPWQVIAFSSEDRTGKDALLARIEEVCFPGETAEGT